MKIQKKNWGVGVGGVGFFFFFFFFGGEGGGVRVAVNGEVKLL